VSEIGVRRIIGQLVLDKKFYNNFVMNPELCLDISEYQITKKELKAIIKVLSSKQGFKIERIHSKELNGYDISSQVRAA
jgi:hypothetical protein